MCLCKALHKGRGRVHVQQTEMDTQQDLQRQQQSDLDGVRSEEGLTSSTSGELLASGMLSLKRCSVCLHSLGSVADSPWHFLTCEGFMTLSHLGTSVRRGRQQG